MPDNSTVIGTYSGVCADADITNLNGLDITREVWTDVFNSDEYKNAIKMGWYIGFLGHPEDPNCMDFRNACIVLREAHLDEDGKVRGTADLIDTPVGRVVKSFQDAGVTFGISVRGAGDIYNNSVEPGTFVFRGFDLVAFPAWESAVPTFTDIAASTDPNKRRTYQKVCADVETNIKNISSVSALKTIRSQFATQSQIYKDITAAIDRDSKVVVSEQEVRAALQQQRVTAMVDLYMNAQRRIKMLSSENKQLKSQMHRTAVNANRKSAAKDKIVAAQMCSLEKDANTIENKLAHAQKLLTASEHRYQELKNNYKVLASKSQKLEDDNRDLKNTNNQLTKRIDEYKQKNLTYNREVIKASTNLHSRDNEISSLNDSLSRTATERDEMKTKVSDLESRNQKLNETINASKKIIEEYQDAYANLYANALGVSADNISITASTSVSELQNLITGNNTFGRTFNDVTDVVETESPVYSESDDIIAL